MSTFMFFSMWEFVGGGQPTAVRRTPEVHKGVVQLLAESARLRCREPEICRDDAVHVECVELR